MVDTVSIYISSSLEVVYESQNRVALCGVILVPRGQIEHLFSCCYFCPVEEESMESGSFSLGQRSTSGRSSFSSENAGDDYNSLKKKKAKDKKMGGGLLGFFR